MAIGFHKSALSYSLPSLEFDDAFWREAKRDDPHHGLIKAARCARLSQSSFGGGRIVGATRSRGGGISDVALFKG